MSRTRVWSSGVASAKPAHRESVKCCSERRNQDQAPLGWPAEPTCVTFRPRRHVATSPRRRVTSSTRHFAPLKDQPPVPQWSGSGRTRLRRCLASASIRQKSQNATESTTPCALAWKGRRGEIKGQSLRRSHRRLRPADNLWPPPGGLEKLLG